MKYGKSCFLLTAYCDNDEKVSVMSDCIDNLQEISNGEIDIFIHSHYPVDIDIQNKVKYVIFDKSNPVLKYPTKGYHFWRNYKNYTMSIVTDDYGYAVLSQWRNGMNYLNNLGYENVFIINYDVFINKNMLEKSYLELDNHDAVTYYWNDGTFNATYCVLDLKLCKLFNTITLENYLKNMNDHFEIYLKKIFDNSKYSVKRIGYVEYEDDFYSSMDINSVVRFVNNNLPNNPTQDPFIVFNHPYPESIEDNSKLICQYHIASKVIVDGVNTNILTFLFFKIRKEMSLKIKIDDLIIYDSLINDDLYLETDYKYEDFRTGKFDVSIIIDDVLLDFKLINKLKENCRITI